MGLSGREERRPGQGRAPLPPSPNRTRRGGRRPPFLLSLLFPPSRILFQLGFPRGKQGEGWPATSPSPNRTRGRGEGRAALPWPPLLFSTKAHYGPLSPRGVPVTPRYSGKIPISPKTLPISKYRLPIYQSSCLDHFETPRHVRDHIRNSEQPSVHQNI